MQKANSSEWEESRGLNGLFSDPFAAAWRERKKTERERKRERGIWFLPRRRTIEYNPLRSN